MNSISVYETWKRRIALIEETKSDLERHIDLSLAKLKTVQDGIIISISYKGFVGRIWVAKKVFGPITYWIVSFYKGGKQHKTLYFRIYRLPRLFNSIDMIDVTTHTNTQPKSGLTDHE